MKPIRERIKERKKRKTSIRSQRVWEEKETHYLPL